MVGRGRENRLQRGRCDSDSPAECGSVCHMKPLCLDASRSVPLHMGLTIDSIL